MKPFRSGRGPPARYTTCRLLPAANEYVNASPNDSGGKRRANAEAHYTVRREDLPLSCPTPDMELWNSHPRVYLPIEKTGRAKCPYCGAEFELED